MKNLLINPVLNKEFKLRFRSFKSFLGLFFYLLSIGGLIIGFIYMETSFSGLGYFRPDQSRTLFMILSYLQLALILFITPGLTAGVISSERERQTLNILLTTDQSSTSIILSKLFSSVSFLFLLIIASLPLYSFVFLFGGISPVQLITIIVFYLFTMFVFGSLGVMFSTLIRKTIISMVTTYGTTLFLIGGTAFLFFLLMSLGQSQSQLIGTNPIPYFFAALNPAIILIGFFEEEIIREIHTVTGVEFPLWAGYTISYTVIAILAIFTSIRKLRPNMKGRDPNRKVD